jgi:hypothetical protein
MEQADLFPNVFLLNIVLMITDLIAVIAAVKASIMSLIGWCTVLIYLLLGLGYLYQFMNPQKS